jgi:hypothetical protein
MFEDVRHQCTDFHGDELSSLLFISLINQGMGSLKLLTFGFCDDVVSSLQRINCKREECELV